MSIYTIDTIDLDTYISDHIPCIDIERVTLVELLRYQQYRIPKPVIYIAYHDGYMQYIGKTIHLIQRIKQHARNKVAWVIPESTHNVGTWFELLHFDSNTTEAELLRYEAILLLLYKPLYNQAVFLRIIGEAE